MGQKVGLFLQKRRTSKGLSQAQLADKLGFASAQSISNFERGANPIPLRLVPKIAAALGFDPEELIECMTEEYRDRCMEALEDAPASRAARMRKSEA